MKVHSTSWRKLQNLWTNEFGDGKLANVSLHIGKTERDDSGIHLQVTSHESCSAESVRAGKSSDFETIRSALEPLGIASNVVVEEVGSRSRPQKGLVLTMHIPDEATLVRLGEALGAQDKMRAIVQENSSLLAQEAGDISAIQSALSPYLPDVAIRKADFDGFLRGGARVEITLPAGKYDRTNLGKIINDKIQEGAPVYGMPGLQTEFSLELNKDTIDAMRQASATGEGMQRISGARRGA